MTEPQPPATPDAPLTGRDVIRNLGIFLVAALLLWWLVFGRGGDDAGDVTPTTERTTVEYRLAVIHGDEGAEDEFGRILDRIQAGSDVCDPEPSRVHVGDVLVASWESSAQTDTMLEWARAAASACGV